jgi:hypothetical protein
MNKSLSKFLKNVDLFGEEVKLNLKGSPLYKTRIGGFGSLILIGILLTFLIFGGINVFSKKTFFVIYYNKLLKVSTKKVV